MMSRHGDDAERGLGFIRPHCCLHVRVGIVFRAHEGGVVT